MVRVGILGSVGSGKTFIANIFKELSFNIFSADNEVANIYKNNKIVNKKIAKFFKLKLYKGKINKQDLRDSLKKNPKKFKFLNKIIPTFFKLFRFSYRLSDSKYNPEKETNNSRKEKKNNNNFTSLPTTTPPASVTALQVKPNSSRFTTPLTSKPIL